MALRKLQSEIDKTLKAVTQGLETFENLYDKLAMSNNATQKDKIETDLKTQIKKLQRMRDQIKAWLSNNDIKDKTALLENRKLIEAQMERFKALEKEMKMKAFSKEGLIAQSKMNPEQKAKHDMIDWIGNMTDELSRQIEATEAEMEVIQTTGKKKNKAQETRITEMEELNEHRNWHVGRLEVVQRMLENGQLSTEQVETIQEDVKYFAEANAEEDFDFDQGIYDDLNLQEEDEFAEFGGNDDTSNLDSSSVVDVLESTPAPKTPAKEDSSTNKKATPATKTTPGPDDQPSSPVSGKKQLSRKSTMDSTKAEPMIKPTKTTEVIPPVPPIPASITTPAKPVSLPPIRYAAAAAAAVASITSPTSTIPPTSQSTETTQSALTSATETTIVQPEPPVAEKQPTPPPAVKSPEVMAPTPTAPQATETPQINGHPPAPPPGIPTSQSPAPQTQQQPQQQPIPPSTNGVPSVPVHGQVPPGYGSHGESSRSGAGYAQQGVMGNLMQSFDMAKELSERRANDVGALHAALDISFNNAPNQLDGEPPRYYHPKSPIKTPSYYPQSRPPILEDKSIFTKFDVDQLFFLFYYFPGTYEQWQAAQELKKQNWRFHKQYLTWFRRAMNPQALTDAYEQGSYFYFDWETSWCQRRKSDFRFEYRWLSDD